jgi:hypothetical protein
MCEGCWSLAEGAVDLCRCCVHGTLPSKKVSIQMLLKLDLDLPPAPAPAPAPVTFLGETLNPP